jgi:SAM-dependent methyltransferase
MAEEIFRDRRLAELYDPLDPDRGDLDAYLLLAEEFGARKVLDIGCGTGVFALLLADRGVEVVGIDPADASLDVARAKPGADRVRWIHGDATALPPLQVDLVTMTANVAQAIADPEGWRRTLAGAYEALRPGGHLVFETRDPARRAWEAWNREDSYGVTEVPGFGTVESWVELTEVTGQLVTFRWHYTFDGDGDGDGDSEGEGEGDAGGGGDGEGDGRTRGGDKKQLTSDSTLRFRERHEIETELAAHGYVLEDVRDAPDRPGREFVFVALRPPAD